MKNAEPFIRSWRIALALVTLGVVIGLAGCSSRAPRAAPVEDRSLGGTRVVPAVTRSETSQAPAIATATSTAPATYVVKPGDTLIRIGLDTGQNWRDIARWNNLENPSQIEVGQVLRLVPPAMVSEAGASTRTTPPAGTAAAPAAASSVVASPVTTPSATATPVPAATARPLPPVAAGATAAENVDENIAWIWPSAGPLLAAFDEVKNKGLDIGGKPGDPIIAVADGRVVYAGAGLRGYGNLVILKHNNLYLTAYAHNQLLLVKEDQSVSKGQKIAEMGSSDSDRVKLHFEIRRQGKPVDPAKYLPSR